MDWNKLQNILYWILIHKLMTYLKSTWYSCNKPNWAVGESRSCYVLYLCEQQNIINEYKRKKNKTHTFCFSSVVLNIFYFLSYIFLQKHGKTSSILKKWNVSCVLGSLLFYLVKPCLNWHPCKQHAANRHTNLIFFS